jgi:hypothetical protein
MTEPTRGLDAATIDALLTDTSPYLSCDECFTRLDEYVEHAIADPNAEDAEDADDTAMTAHLAGCGACAEEAATLRELLLRDAGA